MTKTYFTNLSDDGLKALKKIAPFRKYSANALLHYQGQRPIVAYVVLKGKILLLKKSKVLQKLTKGYIVGYRELFLNLPSPFTAKTLINSEICFIDKSTLLEIQASQIEEIQQLYSELKNAVE
ncbi:MAG: cyclic nucleotide-binding domain-containing protein [Alphaproteobacteria bacterium]|nr:MAG: cyclic nucleotide-binding domain-containing protein [Alphaproteobacteria bacterium]